MKKSFKQIVSWLSLLSILLPSAAAVPGDSVYAAGPEDENEYAAGYISSEEEKNVQPVTADIDYKTAMDRLVASEENEADIVYAAGPDDEFPCSYDEDWLGYFDEKYPPTRDQGNYATCWAESAMSLAEFYMVGHGLADKKIDYSELHLAYWTYTQGTASFAAGDTNDKVLFNAASENGIENILDNGGSLKFAAESLMRCRGFASEKSAPYSGADIIAEGGNLSPASERSNVAYLKNACLIPINFNSEMVKQAIAENGAAGIAVHADKAFYDEEHNSYFCNTVTSTDHALTVVGWDDFFPAENFKKCNGTLPPRDGAWLVRNSYSSENKADYGSYFWLSYYDTSISGAWVFQITESFPWDNHYYYDSQIHGNGYYYDVCEYANVFTVGGEAGAEGERLEAVSFEMAMVERGGSHYKVNIYGGLKGDTPDTGTLIRSATTEGTVYFEGVYTVSLNSPVVFNKGEKFAVVISFDREGSSVVVESAVDNYNSISSKVGMSGGQSFVSTDRLSWADVKGSDKSKGNLVIAAMTSNTGKKSAVSKLVLDPESVTFTSASEHKNVAVKLLDSNGEEANASEYSYIKWSSDDSNIASVDYLGVITPKSNGNTRVTAKYDGISASCEVKVAIPEEGRTAIPVADIKDGSVIDWKCDKLKLSCTTPGAVIYYTLDGTDVSRDSILYSAPVSFDPVMAGGKVTVKAFACAEGYSDSEVTELEYSIPAKGKLTIPAPAKGTVIRSTASGNISLQAKLTLDDSEEIPSKGFEWSVSDENILKLHAGADGKGGIARLTGLSNGTTTVCVSALDSCGERLNAQISISVDIATTGEVHISPVSVNYLYAGDHISISCDSAGVNIYYTLDGTPATASGSLYTGDIIVAPDMVGSHLHVNAIAVKEGLYPSDSVSACYSVKRGKPGKSPLDSLPAEADEEGKVYLVKGQCFYPGTDITWESAAPKIVSIDKKGMVKAKNPGIARLSSKEDPSVFMDVVVAVPKVIVSDRTLASGEEGQAEFYCYLNGVDYTEKYTNMLWFSSDDEVIRVADDGSYKAIGSGNAGVSVYVNGREYSAKLSVRDHSGLSVQPVSDNRVSIELNPLQTGALKIKGVKVNKCGIEGTDLSEELNKKGKVTAYSNDVIRITPKGKLTALGSGITTIRLIPVSDPENPVFVDITVREPVERVYYMQPLKNRKINIKGLKTKGRDAAEFVSDNEDVAIVENGSVISRGAQGSTNVSCIYKGFEFKIKVYVNSAELKIDDKLRVKGNDYVLNLRADDEPYELNWVGDHAQKAVFKNSNNTVAFMDQYEVIYIRGKGKTTLTSTVHGKKIRIKITVN